MTAHPPARVPQTLFDDPAAERRWRARFLAPRMSLPEWALEAPQRCVYQSNVSGTWEIYAWDRESGVHRQVTDRPNGTHSATISPDGARLWWFADTDGDEFGRWVSEPFDADGAAQPAVTLPEGAEPDALDGYSAGLAIGSRVVALGTATDDGTRIWLSRAGGPAELVYEHAEDAGVGALSHDETLLAISHSEHGDSRHPALRALRITPSGTEVLAELADGPGRGLVPLEFPEREGDSRLLVGHERRGRDELLIWDLATGEQHQLDIDLPGDLAGGFYPDGRALLVAHTHAARTTLHRYDLDTGSLTALPTAPGCVGAASVRPDGTVEYGCSSAAHPPSVRALSVAGVDAELLRPPGERAPDSVPVEDVWVDGPGGRIHALIASPSGEKPHPAVFVLHGGPHAADEDRFSAVRAAWVDAGFVVVEVNYRGSTGYGSAWRDAIEGKPGHTELADVAAVHAWCVASGLVDPARCVVNGWSWGGYLTLLALGTQPEVWAAGVAGVPVADYLTAYADEMEQLRAFDRALFGGSPDELPELYRLASPLSYVDNVRAPLLVLAGENDPRCPIRQVDNYLDALASRGADYQVLRFDAGHGSLVVAEAIRHTAAEIGFAQRALRKAP
ncbi:prolyl oligopeptidase family serine peptidase [Pseudonocardia eucalypti]|uniref:Prolyl oligopeptidase family serine peptidase n=1 Tax=Pseudonocardia eucalypti TaxID=648755 RepID=A0ABP9PFD1_9PSEU|nr:dipeptidyl aminopeptidase/acylaminoacyl peptidase [Pseudonocardia eucalypti]